MIGKLKNSKIIINDCNIELPITIIEPTSPLVTALNQISIDIISPQHTIETNQSPKNIILPDTKTELFTEKNVKPEKEKFAFEELTLDHLFLVERKPLFKIYI